MRSSRLAKASLRMTERETDKQKERSSRCAVGTLQDDKRD